MGEGEKEEEKKKKEEGRRGEKNPGLEHLLCWEIDIGWFGTCMEFLFGSLEYLYENYLCKEIIVRMLVWNCLETLVLEILI